MAEQGGSALLARGGGAKGRRGANGDGAGGDQAHLGYQERVNLGSYYTESQLVDAVWQMVIPHLQAGSVVLDSSCGYGAFLREDLPYRQVGGDMDEVALQVAKQRKRSLAFHAVNALSEVGRSKYGIAPTAHLCVIGNPPYNDRTSLIRGGIKQQAPAMDEGIRTRDLGMSFLLSYARLAADLVCVLHPLSYLIKRANFRAIKGFAGQYRLLRGQVVSSGIFKEASGSMHFPILIGLYARSGEGASYEQVMRFPFRVAGGGSFVLADFDDISRYVRKYPSKASQPRAGDLLFWTLRDINALRRNRTFVERPSAHTILVEREQLAHYIYIDVFKQFARHVPYYFGNCDVPIDNRLFQAYRQHFVIECLSRHERLSPHFPALARKAASEERLAHSRQQIRAYLHRLLGSHYVP